MLTANKTFQLTKDRSFTRGEAIPPDVWNALRLRTQNALKGARFVVDIPNTPAPAPAAKRGK